MPKVFIEIRPDGETRTHMCSKSKIRIDAMQRIIGGHIETIPAYVEGTVLIVNDESKLDDLPYNATATDIVAPDVFDWIAGTAIWAKVDGEKLVGFDLSVAEQYIKDLESR